MTNYDDTEEQELPPTTYIPYNSVRVKKPNINNEYTPYGATAQPVQANVLPVAEPNEYPKHFVRVKKHYDHILLHHNITNERKWVTMAEMSKEGVANAFYDADVHWNPDGVTKY